MEKFKFSLATAIAAMLILFTSCLGDKDNESNGAAYGLIYLESSTSGRYFLDGVDPYGFPVYSETIQNYASQYLQSGKERFVGVNYKINYDDEANAGYGSRGYVVGNIEIVDANIETGNKVYARYESIDEEVAVENEVKGGLTLHRYLQSQLLLEASVTNYHKNDEVNFYIEYSTEQEVGTYNGHNAYYIYVRITHTPAETAESRGTFDEKRQFDLSEAIRDFTSVERRKSSSSEGFYIQIKYVSDIDNNGNIKFTTATGSSIPVSLSSNN